MLNRFQFARLRGLRRGKKNAEPEGRQDGDQGRASSGVQSGRAGGNAAHRNPASGTTGPNGNAGGRPADTRRTSGEIRDSWEDDDRVARLLARRAAAQEAERRAALDRLGSRSGAATQDGEGTIVEGPIGNQSAAAKATSVDFTPAVPDTRRSGARTTTVPALDTPQGDSSSAGASLTGSASGSASGAATENAPAPSIETPAPGSPEKLRRYDIPRGAPTGSARVVCIASGKGGTGKSIVATNLALLRAKMGERVLLVDFDAGLANDHLLLGLAPPYDVGHVMTGEVSARDALIDGPGGIKLLAGGVGRQVMIDPTRRELDRLFKALAPLEADFDLILIDHGAGLSYSTVAHLAATSTLILVTNHEVTALSDGYALYKRAHMVNHSIRIGLVVNRVPDEVMAKGAWERFRGAAHKFLGHTPEFIGWVPVDPAIPQAVQMRKPATLSFPDCVAVKALEKIAAWPPIDHARSVTAFYDRARRALR